MRWHKQHSPQRDDRKVLNKIILIEIGERRGGGGLKETKAQPYIILKYTITGHNYNPMQLEGQILCTRIEQALEP